LREVFALGVELLENLKTGHKSIADGQKLTKLKGALELIDQRLNLLSGYDRACEFSSNFATGLRVHAIQAKTKSADWTTAMSTTALPEVSDSTRRECEAEMEKGASNDYQTPQDRRASSPKKNSDDEADDAEGVS
jgi:hypothetical protein